MSFKVGYSFMFFLLWSAYISKAQVNQSTYRKGHIVNVEQWQISDCTFSGRVEKNQNPFDVTFGAVFTGPDGKTMNVPGFYDGGNKWVSRFSTGTIGNWTYETFSSQAELSGLKGSIKVTANTRPNQKGSVLIDPENPQAFVYEDGSSHFLLAFELDWLFALDYDQTPSLSKTEKLLDHIEENGFNHVVMNTYAYDVGWKIDDRVPPEYFYGKPDYSPFIGTNESPDFSRLNLKLFQHLDKVFFSMQARGLDAHLMIYVWNKKVNWPGMYSKEDNQYFDYIIDRYQAFSNIIWDVSKEALDYGRCDIPYINERISRIRQRDAFKRLVTVHDYEYNSTEADRVDFISIQSWRSNLYSLMLEGREIHADKPVVNIEHGGYEVGPYLSFQGNYTSPETCLIRTYECIFAGVYGSYYWQNTSWNIVIHDPFDKKHSFDQPKFIYYKYLTDFFNKYDFNTLLPSNPKITTNSRVGENNLASGGFALSNGKGIYLMMIPLENDRINTVVPEPAGGKLKATWFNPFTGEYKDEGVGNWTVWKEYKKPWVNQAGILILEGE